jgi:hypothetical protein
MGSERRGTARCCQTLLQAKAAAGCSAMREAVGAGEARGHADHGGGTLSRDRASAGLRNPAGESCRMLQLGIRRAGEGAFKRHE